MYVSLIGISLIALILAGVNAIYVYTNTNLRKRLKTAQKHKRSYVSRIEALVAEEKMLQKVIDAQREHIEKQAKKIKKLEKKPAITINNVQPTTISKIRNKLAEKIAEDIKTKKTPKKPKKS